MGGGGVNPLQQPALHQCHAGRRAAAPGEPKQGRLPGNRSLGHLTNAAEREKTGEKIFSHNINTHYYGMSSAKADHQFKILA